MVGWLVGRLVGWGMLHDAMYDRFPHFSFFNPLVIDSFS